MKVGAALFIPQAQQLPAPVTSASKMKSQRHQLYLLKDEESNGSVSLHLYMLPCTSPQKYLDSVFGVSENISRIYHTALEPKQTTSSVKRGGVSVTAWPSTLRG